jgi:hypothetical protein
MLPLKGILVFIILSGAVAAGVVYNVYEDDYFKIDIKIIAIREEGSDIFVDVELLMENRGDSDVLLQRVQVLVMSPDRSIVFVQETLIPPQVLIPAKASVNLIVKDVRILNLEALGSSLHIVVDVEWMSGSDNFDIHIERPFDLGNL